MASIYGDGSDGDLEVTSGIYNLDLNHKYQFSSVNIHSGATLSTGSTTGAVLYITCSGTFQLDGTIDVSNRVAYGDNTWSVTIDGDTYTSPGVAEGGAGGADAHATAGQPAAGYGGGGAGQPVYAGSGGDGGDGGSSPEGGATLTVQRTSAGTSQSDGNAGTNSGGGSGAAYVYLAKDQDAPLKAVGGHGASAYGATGANGSYISTSVSGAFTVTSGGGGGGGGFAGRAGVHVVIKAPTLILNGQIITSGTSGQSGGDGGYGNLLSVSTNGSVAFDDKDQQGGSGGGGGGGNGGNITLVYQDSLTDNSTKVMTAGTGGAAGSSVPGRIGEAGTDGTAGASTTSKVIALQADFSATPLSGAPPLDVSFTDASIGDVTSWAWDFGDGGTSTTESPTHTFSSAGAFTVTLTASNDTMSDTASQVIDVVSDVYPSGTAVSVDAGEPTIEHSPPPPPPPADWSAIGREDKKEYLYKVYDSAGNYIGVWTDVMDEPQFTQQINTPGTTMTVQLGRSADTTKEVRNTRVTQDGKVRVTQDGNTRVVVGQTSNTVGEDTDVDLNYRVDVYVQYGGFNVRVTQDGKVRVTQDGNTRVVTYGSPLGTRIFSGYIMDYTSSYGDQTGVTVTLSSNGAELSQEVIRSDDVTTVTYSDAPLENIVKDILDTNPGEMSYDSSSIDVTGVSETVTFQLNTKLEGIESVYNQTPDGWYWFGNVADNLVYLKAAGTEPDHTFYLGQHIKSVDVKRSIESLVNAIWFVGGQTDPADPTTTVFHYYEDTTSQTTWRKGIDRISDQRYTLDSSMQARAMKEIGKYKDPIFTTPVVISAGKYDIETIRLGEMVGFRNFGNFIDDLILQIVSLNYTPTAVTLQLGQLQDRQVDVINDIQDGLQNAQFATIPTAPS